MPIRSPSELKSDIDRATQILQLFTDPSKGRDVKLLIPQSILRDAHGIIFIRLYRIGFMLSAKSGTGVIIGRLPDGSWSAPSAVSMNSVGFGHQAGGEIIDSIIVMNYRAALKSFYDGGGQLQLGVGASLAVGPLGRAADISASASSTSHIAATYAYSESKGLYIGYSFEGSKISERVNTNAAYYGRPISARDILTGQVPPTQDAASLYNMLNALGAGPRPGLPFAAKSQQQSSMSPLQHSYTTPPAQYTQSPPPPPPVNYVNRPSPTDGFEEPPPPYDGLPPSSSSAPISRNISLNKGTQPTVVAAALPTASSYNYNSTTPIVGGDYKATTAAYYNNMSGGGNQSPPPPNSPYGKAPLSSFHRGSIHDEAVTRTGTFNNNHLYDTTTTSSSSSSQPPPPQQQQQQQQNTTTDIKNHYPISENTMTVVIAKYDYTSDNPHDLTFSTGDTIIVTKRLGDRQAWWEGEIGTKRGFFPANYTEDME